VRLATLRDERPKPQQLPDRVAGVRRGLAQQPPRLPAGGVSRLRLAPARRVGSRDPCTRTASACVGRQATTTRDRGGQRVITQPRAPATDATLEILRRLLAGYDRDFAVRLWDGTVWEPEPGRPARFTLVLNQSSSLRAMLADPRQLQLSLAEAF